MLLSCNCVLTVVKYTDMLCYVQLPLIDGQSYFGVLILLWFVVTMPLSCTVSNMLSHCSKYKEVTCATGHKHIIRELSITYVPVLVCVSLHTNLKLRPFNMYN